MKNNKLGKVKIGVDGVGINRFDLSHDHNTSMEFGDCEVQFVHEMKANSKMSFKNENLVRLAPLVAPAFGRMRLHNFNWFVRYKDIFPFYDSLLSDQRTLHPNSTGNNLAVSKSCPLPHISANRLFTNCFVGAQVGGWYWTRGDLQNNIKTPYQAKDWEVPHHSSWDDKLSSGLYALPEGFSGSPWLPRWQFESSATTLPQSHINLAWLVGYDKQDGIFVNAPAGTPLLDSLGNIPFSESDYTVFTAGASDSNLESAAHYNAHTFKFSNYGRRFAKILRACGYTLDLTDGRLVSLMPLLALYRAYFETYGLQLYKNWEQTPAYALILRCMNPDSPGNRNVASSNFNDDWYNTDGIFWRFMRDLTNMWVTDPQDVVSAMTPSQTELGASILSESSSYNGRFMDFIEHGQFQRYYDKLAQTTITDDSVNHSHFESDVPSIGSVGTSVSNQNRQFVGSPIIDKVKHSELDSRLLKKASKWINRQSILGARIAETLNAMGAEKYAEPTPCSFIGHSVNEIKISDVTSLADTSGISGGKGASLGEFGGKGVGYNGGKKFKWRADYDGIWISFSAIIPESGLCQMSDQALFNLSTYDLYKPDFEKLGSVPYSKSFICGQRYSSARVGQPNSELPQEVGCMALFGYAPRYTEYKVARNVLNGDFARAGTMDTYAPYHLDKFFPIARPHSYYDETGKKCVVDTDRYVTISDLPSSGLSWRYNSRYPWLSNFSRIFANEGELPKSSYGLSLAQLDELAGESVGYSLDCLTYNDDNFIVHNANLVTYNAPMLPIEDCFEAYEDDKGANGATTKQ